MRDKDIVPCVALKSHLDGDPKPRRDEIIEWDLMRRSHAIDRMIVLILLPDGSETEEPFPGYQVHKWAIFERRGKVVCEPATVEFQVGP